VVQGLRQTVDLGVCRDGTPATGGGGAREHASGKAANLNSTEDRMKFSLTKQEDKKDFRTYFAFTYNYNINEMINNN